MHNKTKTKTQPQQTMGSTLNNRSPTKEPLLRTISSLSYRRGLKCILLRRQIFALDSGVVKAQNCLAHMDASQLMQCIITEKQFNDDETKKRIHD